MLWHCGLHWKENVFKIKSRLKKYVGFIILNLYWIILNSFHDTYLVLFTTNCPYIAKKALLRKASFSISRSQFFFVFQESAANLEYIVVEKRVMSPFLYGILYNWMWTDLTRLWNSETSVTFTCLVSFFKRHVKIFIYDKKSFCLNIFIFKSDQDIFTIGS